MSCGEEEEEIDLAVNRVASVTLESDSLPGSPPLHKRSRRKRRRMGRPRTRDEMDVDVCKERINLGHKDGKDAGDEATVHAMVSDCRLLRVGMDWQGVGGSGESSLSSSGTDSGNDGGREADDEHSDWVEGACEWPPSGSTEPAHSRAEQAKPVSPSSHVFARQLQRFIRNEHQQELVFKPPMRSFQLNRIAQHYGLEVLKRFSGTVVLRKKNKG